MGSLSDLGLWADLMFQPQETRVMADNYSKTSKGLLTARELGDYLGVSLSTVRRLVRDDPRLPVVRVRGAVRFNAAAVEAVLTNIGDGGGQ